MNNTAPKPTQKTRKRKTPDRLARAIFHANELSDSRLRKTKAAHQNRWTVSARAKKAFLIQIHRPWRYATGPKTQAGKARASQNARIHDPQEQAVMRFFNRAIIENGRFLTRLNRAIAVWKVHPAIGNELFKTLRPVGQLTTLGLAQALGLAIDYYDGAEKGFSDWGKKVNTLNGLDFSKSFS